MFLELPVKYNMDRNVMLFISVCCTLFNKVDKPIILSCH